MSSYFNPSPPVSAAVDDGPTAEQWAALRAALERGNANAECLEAGIDPRCVRLFATVLTADRQADEALQAAVGAEDERRDATERLRLLRQAAPTSVAEVDALNAAIRECQQRRDVLTAAIENARISGYRREGLRQMFPGLLGIERRVPLTCDIPSIVADELRRLNLPTDRSDPWTALPAIQPVVRRQTVSTKQSFAKGK